MDSFSLVIIGFITSVLSFLNTQEAALIMPNATTSSSITHTEVLSAENAESGETTQTISTDSIPVPRASTRPLLLTFGLYVTPDPDENPIDPPERFTGFHAGTDFEILEGEEDTEVPVSAICEGSVIFSDFVKGYGGVVIQSCTLDEKNVTVLYGHLAVSSLAPKGTFLQKGRQLGILGAGRSNDTDGSRKHLHLSVHKGSAIEFKGYVQSEEELDAFIDPMTVLSTS